MAIGIDLGFISLGLAVLVVPAEKRAAVVRYAAPAIAGTLAISAAMNGFAFGAHANYLPIYPAAAFGLTQTYSLLLDEISKVWRFDTQFGKNVLCRFLLRLIRPNLFNCFVKVLVARHARFGDLWRMP
jgi:hypothetical protein